jgi:mannose-1-phosphate guanylyltransferase
MRPLDAVIVAGGRGTRLQPLTHDTPKPLIEFCGEPFLGGVLARLAAAGIERVLLVVGTDTEPFEILRPTAEGLGLRLEMVPEPTPLDTAGGVRAVAETLRSPVLICNGDILTDLDLDVLINHHTTTGADATIALTRVQDTSSFGVCVREGSRITSFVEKPAPGTLPGQDAINAGTYLLDPALLLRFEHGRLSFERQVFPGVLEMGGHLEGVIWDGAWADLGTPERLHEGHRMALDGELRWPSVEAVPDRGDGVRIAPDVELGDDVSIVGPVLILGGAVIEKLAKIGPHVVIGRDCRVGPETWLRRSVLGSRTEVRGDVRADSVLTGPDAVIDAGVSIVGDTVLGPGGVLTRMALAHRGDDERPTAVAGTRVPAPRG